MGLREREIMENVRDRTSAVRNAILKETALELSDYQVHVIAVALAGSFSDGYKQCIDDSASRALKEHAQMKTAGYGSWAYNSLKGGEDR